MRRAAPLACMALLLSAGCHEEAGATEDLGDLDMPATVTPDLVSSPQADFPSTPVVDPGLPPGFPDQFNAAADGGGGGGGPCIVEPALGAMIPSNFAALGIDWKPSGSENVYELRIHVANQVNDLVVYTTQKSYVMPEAMWQALLQHSADLDVTIGVRGGVLSGTTLIGNVLSGTSATVHLAPVPAPGSIVYFATSPTSALKGFTVGAKAVTTVVTPAKLNDGTTCVGCHSGSPDGVLAFLSRQGASGSNSIDARRVDGSGAKASDTEVSANALAKLGRQNQTLPTLSPAHYSAIDAVAISTLTNATDTNNRTELVWTDLHAASGGTGILVRSGDARDAATPSFSHDGTKIVYTSSSTVVDGRTGSADTDLYVVPYNDHAGGVAVPLSGASAAGIHEFYPAFSADDAYIAYDQSPPAANTYNEPKAEVYVIPAAGGTGKRLAANDPPACAGVTSPGVTNSWPRWAPEVKVSGARRFHWLVFSSTRRGVTSGAHPDPLPQLYLAAVVVDSSSGLVTDYPALYVRSQPADEANHTPAWGAFQLPPAP